MHQNFKILLLSVPFISKILKITNYDVCSTNCEISNVFDMPKHKNSVDKYMAQKFLKKKFSPEILAFGKFRVWCLKIIILYFLTHFNAFALIFNLKLKKKSSNFLYKKFWKKMLFFSRFLAPSKKISVPVVRTTIFCLKY